MQGRLPPQTALPQRNQNSLPSSGEASKCKTDEAARHSHANSGHASFAWVCGQPGVLNVAKCLVMLSGHKHTSNSESRSLVGQIASKCRCSVPLFTQEREISPTQQHAPLPLSQAWPNWTAYRLLRVYCPGVTEHGSARGGTARAPGTWLCP